MRTIEFRSNLPTLNGLQQVRMCGRIDVPAHARRARQVHEGVRCKVRRLGVATLRERMVCAADEVEVIAAEPLRLQLGCPGTCRGQREIGLSTLRALAQFQLDEARKCGTVIQAAGIEPE